MNPQVLRLLIRRKFDEGGLPHHRVPRVRGGPGGGGVCDGCGTTIGEDQTAVEGTVLKSGRPLVFHALCFELWDDERPAARGRRVFADGRPASMEPQAATRQRPGTLGAEERALLFTYCRDHSVGECVSCGGFALRELASDRLGRTHLCPHCNRDLTDSVRAHLSGCAILPQEARRLARAVPGAARYNGQPNGQPTDRADALVCGAEAALGEIRRAMRQAPYRGE